MPVPLRPLGRVPLPRGPHRFTTAATPLASQATSSSASHLISMRSVRRASCLETRAPCFRSLSTSIPRLLPSEKPHPPRTPSHSSDQPQSRTHTGTQTCTPPPNNTWVLYALSGLAGGGTLALYSYLSDRSSQQPVSPVTDPEQFSPWSHLNEETVQKYAPTLAEQEESLARKRSWSLRVRTLWTQLRVTWVTFVWEPLGTAGRFVYLACLFLPVLISAPICFLGSHTRAKAELEEGIGDARDTTEGPRRGALLWYRLLVHTLEAAGPTFVKLGQWAGSRRDLFPPALCEAFGKLHSNGRPHSAAYTRKVIERVFGERTLEEIFESFDPKPMGVGAVAQVYIAQLKPDLVPPPKVDAAALAQAEDRAHWWRAYERRAAEWYAWATGHPAPVPTQSKVGATITDEVSKIGRQLTAPFEQDAPPEPVFTGLVAIKVLHPNVHRTINRDIKIMNFFARLLNLLPGAEWLSLPEEVEVFAGMMMSQLDLRNEAENLLQFTTNFSRRRSAVTFPQPLVQFTTKELLIETWENAVPLTDLLARTGRGEPGPFDHRLADIGLDAFLSMLLRDNFTHADLHPGNIMVKFYQPTTQSILKDVMVRIMARFDSDYVPAAANLENRWQEDDLVDDQVTETLRRISSDKSPGAKWQKEMERLDRAGYLPQLVILDAGLTVQLSAQNRQNFIDLFAAIASFDGNLAAKLMAERSRYPDQVIDQDGFEVKMSTLLQRVRASTFKLGAIKIGDLLSQTLTLVRRHHVKMEADFVNTVLSILLLEGIGRQLDPELDVFARSLPVLRSVGKEISVQSVLDEDGNTGLHVPSSSELSNVAKLLPMLRFYLLLEARNWVNQISDTRLIDAWVKFDWLSPNV